MTRAEAHRSIFNKYGSVFKYFDSLLVGLTATPRSEVDADTYKIFGCESGVPHFEYKLESAVKDHYLVPYKVEKRTTALLKGGIKYKYLSEDDKEKVESIIIDELDEDSVIPAKELFKKIYNENTCSKVLDDLMTNGIHINDGQLLGKTIIFAYNHKHAEMIVETFKKNYPNLKDEFCQLIDNKVKGADDLILQFGESKDFRIAVSVDMLDTGIDVPSVLNLVFFKPVKSHIKFVQMIGRGTRLCEGLLDGKDKQYFLIFDYCSNFEYFEEHPDGIEHLNGKSLGQRLFDVKLDILVELQKWENQSNKVCKQYYDMLKPELYGKVRELKDNSSRISVREKMDYVDKYNDIDQWSVIEPLKKKEIQYNLSALINKDVDEDVNALRFDMLMFNIELDVLINSKHISIDSQRQVREVRRISSYLLNYASGNPAVFAKADSLKMMVDEDFWMQEISIDKLEDCREDIRNLLIYLPPKSKPVSIDTPDVVEQLDGGDSPLIDIRTYREKVIDYLEKHMDSVAISKIKNLDKINADDMKELERILWNELGSEEEYKQNSNTDNLIVFIRSIIGVEQEVINEKFSEFLNQNELNSLQQEYISEIIDYVRENGDIEMNVLLNEEPFGNYKLFDLFGNNVYIIKNIVNTIHDSSLVA